MNGLADEWWMNGSDPIGGVLYCSLLSGERTRGLAVRQAARRASPPIPTSGEIEFVREGRECISVVVEAFEGAVGVTAFVSEFVKHGGGGSGWGNHIITTLNQTMAVPMTL